MRINESRFRQILREESRKFMKEQWAEVGSAFKQAFDPNTVSQEEESETGAGTLDIMGAGVNAAASGFDATSQTALATALASYIRLTAVEKVASTGTGLATGLPSATTGAQLAYGAVTGAGTGSTAVTAAGGGAVGVTSAIIAPVALGIAGTWMAGKIAVEGWKAYKIGADQASKNAKTAASNAVRQLFNAGVTKGKQNKLWTSEQLRAVNSSEMLRKFLSGEALNNQDTAFLTLVFSGVDYNDMYNAMKEARSFAPELDSSNILTAPMQLKSHKTFVTTLESLMSKFSEQIKSFQSAAKAAADSIKAAQASLASKKAKEDKSWRESELQKIADRVDFEQGRIPSSYKPVPVGTAAARAAKNPTPASTKKPGS